MTADAVILAAAVAMAVEVVMVKDVAAGALGVDAMRLHASPLKPGKQPHLPSGPHRPCPEHEKGHAPLGC